MAEQRCECGRPWSECVYAVQRSSLTRWLYFRCPTCLREWTVPEVAPDLSEPASADEVLALHELLSSDNFTFPDLQPKEGA